MSILIVDDHPLVRRGIIDILSIGKSGEEIKEAGNIEQAIKILKKHSTNIIMVDIHLGTENGFNLIETARKILPNIKIIVLTSSSNVLDLRQAKELKVDGYLLKDAFVEDIIYALNVIRRGGRFYSYGLVEKSINGMDPPQLKVLTVREKEVFSQLSKGMTNAQISAELYISEGTTKKHISSILSKLNLNNRIEVILYAEKIYGSSSWEVSNAI